MTEHTQRTVLNDRYEVQQRIGRGGMADVFLARDLLLDRPVAIKVLFPEFATDPSFVERFRREAQAAANLTHPNIVAVYDWGKYSNTYFMAMEYVQGRTLADILKANGHVNSMQATEIANEVAAALSHAHRSGVVHRDIKPANILIGGNGQVKVADFGIARAMNAPTEKNLTQVGSVMGTATYFSPEQAQGANPDPRSDLYSLGIVLYEMVAGKPPFTGENPVSIAYKQVHDLPQPLNQIVADVPRAFEAIVAKLLAKDPGMRYANADALREDLRRYRAGEPVMALASVMQSAGVADQTRIVADSAAADNVTRTMPRTTATPAQAGTTVMARTPMQAMPPPTRRRGIYGLLAFLGLLALVAGGIVLFNVLKKDDATAADVTMPNVVGQPYEQAFATLTGAPYNFNVTPVEQATEGAAEGAVVATDPVADAPATAGQDITVYVNPVKQPKPIPDVRGKSVEEATQILGAEGFAVDANVVAVDDPGVEAGKVASTTPAAGEAAKQGAVITLNVSKAPDQVVVPSVEGMVAADAQALLQGEPNGLKVTVTQEPSASIEAGKVIRTDPPATATITKGSAITVFVSSGPAPVRVPPVEGQTEAQARNQLVKLGLVPEVSYVTVATGSADDGHVISQSIQSGTEVSPGSTVRLKVGKAAPPPTTTSSTTTTTSTTTTSTTTTTTTTLPTPPGT